MAFIILIIIIIRALTGSTPVHDLDLHDLAGVSPRSHRVVLVLHRPRRKFPQAREQPSPVTTCGNRKDTVCIPARARHSCSPPPPSADTPVPLLAPSPPPHRQCPPLSQPAGPLRANRCCLILGLEFAVARAGPLDAELDPMLRHTLLRIMTLNILGDAMQEQNVQDSTFRMYTESEVLCSLHYRETLEKGSGTRNKMTVWGGDKTES